MFVILMLKLTYYLLNLNIFMVLYLPKDMSSLCFQYISSYHFYHRNYNCY